MYNMEKATPNLNINKLLHPSLIDRGLGLYDFQQELVNSMLSCPLKYKYNGSDMGLGKTIIAYTYAYLKRPAIKNMLVICPAMLRLNWEEESIWAGGMFKTKGVVLSSNALTEILGSNSKPDLLIVSYDMLVNSRKLLGYILNRSWDMVVCDEFHYCKNLGAKRTQYTLAVIRDIPDVHLLSGTPITKSALDIFPALKEITPTIPNLDPDIYRTYTCERAFKRAHLEVEFNFHGATYSGFKNPEKLKEFMCETGGFFFRKVKSKVLKELPPKSYQLLHCNAKVPKLTKALEKEMYKLVLDYERNGKTPSMSDTGTHLATLRKELGQIKAMSHEIFVFVKENILEQGKPVVLFAYHRTVITILQDLYKDYGTVTLDGSTSPTNKQKAVVDFQGGRANVFIGQLQASGVGITLTRASDAVFYEIDWLPSTQEQAIDRVHRIGTIDPVTAYYPITKNKIDTKIINVMIKRQKDINKII